MGVIGKAKQEGENIENCAEEKKGPETEAGGGQWQEEERASKEILVAGNRKDSVRGGKGGESRKVKVECQLDWL